MKCISILIVLFLSLNILSHGQSEFGGGISGIKPIQLPTGMDALVSSEGFIYYQYKGFSISKHWVFNPQ